MMTHYMVTVRVSAARLVRHKGDLDAALDEMLAPYNEQTEDRRFQAFVADEDGDETHEGATGYWRNPNAKWDWYSVGGRGTGWFPIKPGVTPVHGKPGLMTGPAARDESDVVFVSEVDMDRVARDTRERMTSWLARYRRWCADPASMRDEDPFSDTRRRAMDLGLLRVEQGPATAGPGEFIWPWSNECRPDDSRRTWTDVATLVTDDAAFAAKFESRFCTVATYAALDDDGWHAPGRVGWWDSSSETPDDGNAHYASFVDRFIRAAAPDDLLVAVDCHI